MSDFRILFSHPHPDDETIAAGGTIARYVAEGVGVTVVTGTLGEEGEIHVPALAGLAADQADQLGGFRASELANAMRALGVTDHRYLGGAGAYRDSGMMGEPANDKTRAFWRADVETAGKQLAAVIDDVRPHVVVSDDENGSYGHPDHIQMHRVTKRGLQLATWRVPKVYYNAVPRSVMATGIARFAESDFNPFEGVTNVDDLDFVTPDEEITASIVIAEFTDAKDAAMRAHATQIPADSWLHQWSENFGGEPAEYFKLASGERGPGAGQYGWESDLFAGLR